MTPYDLTPAQLADISTAFEELSAETQRKFVWFLDPINPDSKALFPEIEIDDIFYYPTSDRAMAVLDEMGYGYAVSKTAVHYWKDMESWGKEGSSPLHALLLALKEIGG